MTENKSYNFTKFHRWWRPAMAWSYLIVCLFDFVIAPTVHGIFMTFFLKGATYAQWVPLTLQGAGLYHTSMLAIIGVTVFGRTKEKLQILKDEMSQLSNAANPSSNTTSNTVTTNSGGV